MVDAADLENLSHAYRNGAWDGVKFGETLTGSADGNAELRLGRDSVLLLGCDYEKTSLF